jgi:hypothetical protein
MYDDVMYYYHVFPIGLQELAPRHYICTIDEYFLTVDLLPKCKKFFFLKDSSTQKFYLIIFFY